MTEPLRTVELTIALDVALRTGKFGLSERERALMRDIRCKVRPSSWAAPDTTDPWPKEVFVFARRESQVLFYTTLGELFGVGRVGATGVIEGVRIYPSLSRALYALSSHES